MATVLFLVGFLGLMIFPSKYINVGGYGFLLSALSVSLIMLGKGEELREWSFWVISILAIGCIGHWLKGVSDKNKR